MASSDQRQNEGSTGHPIPSVDGVPGSLVMGKVLSQRVTRAACVSRLMIRETTTRARAHDTSPRLQGSLASAVPRTLRLPTLPQNTLQTFGLSVITVLQKNSV